MTTAKDSCLIFWKIIDLRIAVGSGASGWFTADFCEFGFILEQ